MPQESRKASFLKEGLISVLSCYSHGQKSRPRLYQLRLLRAPQRSRLERWHRRGPGAGSPPMLPRSTPRPLPLQLPLLQAFRLGTPSPPPSRSPMASACQRPRLQALGTPLAASTPRGTPPAWPQEAARQAARPRTPYGVLTPCGRPIPCGEWTQLAPRSLLALCQPPRRRWHRRTPGLLTRRSEPGLQTGLVSRLRSPRSRRSATWSPPPPLPRPPWMRTQNGDSAAAPAPVLRLGTAPRHGRRTLAAKPHGGREPETAREMPLRMRPSVSPTQKRPVLQQQGSGKRGGSRRVEAGLCHLGRSMGRRLGLDLPLGRHGPGARPAAPALGVNGGAAPARLIRGF